MVVEMTKFIKLLAFPFLVAVLAYSNINSNAGTWIYPNKNLSIQASTQTSTVTATVFAQKPVLNTRYTWPPPKPFFPEDAVVWKPKLKDYSGSSYKGFSYSPIRELNKPVFISSKSTCTHKNCKPRYYKSVCSCAMEKKLYIHDHRILDSKNKKN